MAVAVRSRTKAFNFRKGFTALHLSQATQSMQRLLLKMPVRLHTLGWKVGKKMRTSAENPASPVAAAIPKSFALYGKILNVYTSMGLLQHKWTHGRLQVVESNRLWLVIRIALIYLHIAFMDVRWAGSLFTKRLESSQMIYFTLQATVYSAMAVNFMILTRNARLVAATMNNLLRLQRRHGEFVWGDKGTGARRVIKVTLFVCALGPLSYAAGVLREPNHPRSLVSLASSPANVAAGWKVACSIYQFYSIFAVSATLWMTVSTVTVFLSSLTRTITAIKKLGYEDLIKEINEINLLLTWFNCTFRQWTVVWEATFIWLVVVDLTMAVMQQSIPRLLVAGSIATMMMYLFKSMGKIYEQSKGIMENAVPRAQDDSWFKRKHRAYRALRVNVGSFNYVDKGLVLTILSITMQSTANLMVTLRTA